MNVRHDGKVSGRITSVEDKLLRVETFDDLEQKVCRFKVNLKSVLILKTTFMDV